MNQFPVTIGHQYTVNFPMGGPQLVTCVEPNRVGFKGTTAAGKTVTVRSYKLVDGLSDYTPPPILPKQPEIGQTYVITSGRGRRTVVCASIVNDREFAESDGTIRQTSRIIWDSPTVETPKPSKKSGTIFLTVSGRSLQLEYNDDKQWWELTEAGNLLYRSSNASSVLEVLSEI